MASALDLQTVALGPEPGSREEPWRGLKRGCCDQWCVLNNGVPRHTVGLVSGTLLSPEPVPLRLPCCPYVVRTPVGPSDNRATPAHACPAGPAVKGPSPCDPAFPSRLSRCSPRQPTARSGHSTSGPPCPSLLDRTGHIACEGPLGEPREMAVPAESPGQRRPHGERSGDSVRWQELRWPGPCPECHSQGTVGQKASCTGDGPDTAVLWPPKLRVSCLWLIS